MTVAIDLTGAVETIAALEALLRPGWLVEPTEAAAKAVLPTAQGYPPPVPGSTYQRQNILRDGWAIAGGGASATASGAQAVVTNPVWYAPLVVGETAQAWMHEDNGWPTESEIAKLATPDAVAAFMDEFEAELARMWA